MARTRGSALATFLTLIALLTLGAFCFVEPSFAYWENYYANKTYTFKVVGEDLKRAEMIIGNRTINLDVENRRVIGYEYDGYQFDTVAEAYDSYMEDRSEGKSDASYKYFVNNILNTRYKTTFAKRYKLTKKDIGKTVKFREYYTFGGRDTSEEGGVFYGPIPKKGMSLNLAKKTASWYWNDPYFFSKSGSYKYYCIDESKYRTWYDFFVFKNDKYVGAIELYLNRAGTKWKAKNLKTKVFM